MLSADQFETLKSHLSLLPLAGLPKLTVADALVSAELADDQSLTLNLEFGMPFGAYAAGLAQAVEQHLASQYEKVELQLSWSAVSTQTQLDSKVEGVKNIIAVASGKGGVGKSTTSANLALALASLGANVGVLDADIYGPSQAHMLGVSGKRPEMHSANQMLPLLALNGVKVIGMGNLVTDKTPMIWRGPMVSGALQQLLNNTYWQDIDYLIVDMPPGTGDIQLTLAQSVPVSGAIVVTTPQDIALLDARKGIEMFNKVQIPVLGVVENMATHICSNCGHSEAIFGEGGGEALAQEYEVDVLGRLPLQLSIREQTDRGLPPVAAEPASPVSKAYIELATRAAAELWSLSLTSDSGPQISMSDD